ncbi:hypothetical protein F4802DRAFT_615303 [Xylaria palmicola]|nr:hypothetical protein F4802DRAFT_615303 [Xylaria palmicola]
MASKTFTVPTQPRLTHGTELEMLVAYLFTSEIDPDEANSGALAPILRIDAPEDEQMTSEIIKEHIRTTLCDYGIRVRQVETSPTEDLPTHLAGLDAWDVDEDSSVHEGKEEKDLLAGKEGQYRWFNLELRSPAYRDTPDAYKEMEFVVNLMKQKYRVRVNTFCGLHVHVGNGARPFDAKTLRRAGAFLFAADPMLSRLHAPWRRVGPYSSSIRHGSRLARWEGMTAADAEAVLRDQRGDLSDRAYEAYVIRELPWSDLSSEESDLSPPMANSPIESAGQEGGIHQRHLLRLMARPAFRARCWEVFEQVNPEALTSDELYTLVVLEQCDNMYGHVAVSQLSDSEFNEVAIACAPYIAIGRSSWEWDAMANRFTIRDAQIGAVLEEPRPITQREIDGDKIIKDLEALAEKQAAEADERINQADYSAPGNNSSGETSSDFVPASWTDLGPSDRESSNSGGENETPLDSSESTIKASSLFKMPVWDDSATGPSGSRSRPKSRPPTDVTGLRTRSGDAKRSPSLSPTRILSRRGSGDDGDDEASSGSSDTSSSFTNNVSDFSHRGTAGWSDDADADTNTNTKLRPHDVRYLPQPYIDDVTTAHELREALWARVSWLPRPGGRGAPDPDEPHARGSDACGAGRHGCRRHVVTDTLAGLAALLGADSGAAVGAMLLPEPGEERLNYNFAGYALVRLLWAGTLRTLEFREAAGSLDAAWVAAWARICVGVVRFCRDASPRRFGALLDKIVAEEERQQRQRDGDDKDGDDKDDGKDVYDVCDLLEDMCLFAEAETVRRRERTCGPPR